MTTIEVKTEIQQALDKIPESVLKYVLDYMNELQKHTADDIELADFMKQTLIEDRELLEKLAR